MISGKYLGEIVRQALLALIKSEVLFGGKPSEKFDKFEAFETKFVSMIEAGYVIIVESNSQQCTLFVSHDNNQGIVSGHHQCMQHMLRTFFLQNMTCDQLRIVHTLNNSDVGECKKIFKENFSIEASDEDCHNVKRVCAAVSTRAARLAGAGVVALVKKINKLDGCTVAVDGSLYKMHPTFPKK